MAFWGSHEIVDEFDVYDPTTYSGGYDLHLTYGRPLPPSDETCYALSAAGDVHVNRPHFSSGSHKSTAYESDATLYWNCGGGYGILPPNFPKPISICTLHPPPPPQTNIGYPDFASSGDAPPESTEQGTAGVGIGGVKKKLMDMGGMKSMVMGGKASYERPCYYGGEEGGRYERSKHERAALAAASDPNRYIEKRKPIPDPQETGLIYGNRSETKKPQN